VAKPTPISFTNSSAERASGSDARQNVCVSLFNRNSHGDSMEKIKIEQQTFMGSVWIAAWLFTIGFLHLGFWRGVLAIVLWPYYLGGALSSLAH